MQPSPVGSLRFPIVVVIVFTPSTLCISVIRTFYIFASYQKSFQHFRLGTSTVYLADSDYMYSLSN